MSEEEKELLRLLYINNLSQYGKRKLEDYIKKLQEENNKLKKQIDLMAEDLTTDYHSKEWVIKNYEEKVK